MGHDQQEAWKEEGVMEKQRVKRMDQAQTLSGSKVVTCQSSSGTQETSQCGS